MSAAFYKSIIEDEMKVFGIKEESLKQAAISVGKTYSRQSLTRGQTFLDYNIPSNRCAYLYKYAFIHTGLVSKFFRKLMKKKEVKSSLKRKHTLKICCLGGGPGTDIVGLFKALAMIPHYHKKVTEVTVLDICGGWRNSFKRIISNLTEGKVKDVPETFVDISNFKFKLIEVNLLNNLPSNIVTIIAEADIVCMVKFVSAILGSSTSVSALQVIGEKLKVGAVVLFIDNFQGSTFKPFLDISGFIGLKIVLGPLHEGFGKRTGITANERKIYGCLPLAGTRVTVLGFIKTDKVCNVINESVNLSSKTMADHGVVDEEEEDDDDSWSTDDESEKSPKQTSSNLLDYSVKVYGDKFTQTDKKNVNDKSANSGMATVSVNELYTLVDRLCGLVNVLSQWKQKFTSKRQCHCH